MTLMNVLRSTASRFFGSEDTSTDEAAYQPPHLLVSEEVCEETRRGLRSHSPSFESHEGVIFWAGASLPSQSTKVVRSVIVPEATTSPGSYAVSAEANAAVVNAVHDHDIELLATVHSHPGEMTSHSKLDSEKAQLPHEGYFSVVVPNYAEDGVRPFTECGVHVYHDGQFMELDGTTVEDRVTTLSSAPTYIDTREP